MSICLHCFISHYLPFLFLTPTIGLVHTTGGYALYAMHTTATTFGLTQQSGPPIPNAPHKDVYACVADAGWITGHTYIVSPNPFCITSLYHLFNMMRGLAQSNRHLSSYRCMAHSLMVFRHSCSSLRPCIRIVVGIGIWSSVIRSPYFTRLQQPFAV